VNDGVIDWDGGFALKKKITVFIGAAAVVLTVVLAVSAGLLLASCGCPSFGTGTVEEMEKVVEEVMSQQGIPGVIAGVWGPERGNWTTARGKADLESGVSIDLLDRVRIASNTKPFVATVMLQLVDEGRLSLDDRLDEFIDGFQHGDRISIRQLANMTSGIYSFTEDPRFDEDFEEDPLMQWSQEQALEIARGHEPYFPPGEGWHYSDTNYEILGLIIEQVTGNDIEGEINRRIIEPLGLANTVFPTESDIPGRHSKGYHERDGRLVDYTRVNPEIPWAGGAMISNLNDMKKWAMVAAEGSLLTEEMHEEQLEWVSMDQGSPSGYGLGLVNVHGFIGHHGAIFGFNSVFFYNPDDKSTIVVFANKSSNESGESSDIFIQLVRILYPDELTLGQDARPRGLTPWQESWISGVDASGGVASHHLVGPDLHAVHEVGLSPVPVHCPLHHYLAVRL
jgi:D-alanyl-D-alanine carboxypeptidase